VMVFKRTAFKLAVTFILRSLMWNLLPLRMVFILGSVKNWLVWGLVIEVGGWYLPCCSTTVEKNTAYMWGCHRARTFFLVMLVGVTWTKSNVLTLVYAVDCTGAGAAVPDLYCLITLFHFKLQVDVCGFLPSVSCAV
jgi:hypothetical protein